MAADNVRLMTTAAPVSGGVESVSESDAPGVVLIPWDPDSEEHVLRMHQQRVACGWKEEKVESWRQLQREGKMGIHWITLPPTHHSTTTRLKAHTTTFPTESAPLHNTGTTILTRRHIPSPLTQTFIPIGHISLDAWTPDPTHSCSASTGVYSISTFYVSAALRRGGIGVLAMGECERLARETFAATAITLDTLAKEEQAVDSPRRIAMGQSRAKALIQEWYEKQGYVPYAWKKDAYFDKDPTGKVWGATCVYLRKELV